MSTFSDLSLCHQSFDQTPLRRGGTVLHQCAFIVIKNVETLHPINATTSVIPVSNLLPLCGNNFRVYKRVRFPSIVGRTGAVLSSPCVVRAEPHFARELHVRPGAVAHGSCDYVLSTAAAELFDAA